MGEERSVRKPGRNAGSDCLEVSLCLCELLQCHCEFFVKHLKFVLAGTGGAWLMAVGAWARQAAFSAAQTQLRVKLSRMLQMTFLSEMFAAEKKKNHHFSSYFETESIDGVCTPFFLHLSWGKEVMEEMEKRGCSWDYEKFGFTRCNCLNCSLANFMDKI